MLFEMNLEKNYAVRRLIFNVLKSGNSFKKSDFKEMKLFNCCSLKMFSKNINMITEHRRKKKLSLILPLSVAL